MSSDRRPSHQDVRAQLSRIIDSAEFRNAKRLRGFLRYVVARTMAAEPKPVDGYSIAVDVFGKPSSFDPSADSLVRVQAGQLRLKLAQYYSNAGKNDPVLIEVPRGSYAPSFSWSAARHSPSLNAHKSRSKTDPDACTTLCIDAFRAHDDLENVAATAENALIRALSQSMELKVIPHRLQSRGDQARGANPFQTYILDGELTDTNGIVHIHLTVTTTDEGVVVWTSSLDLSPDEEVDLALSEWAERITAVLSGPAGLLPAIAYRHARSHGYGHEAPHFAVLGSFAYTQSPSKARYETLINEVLRSLEKHPSHGMLWALGAMLHLDADRFGFVPPPLRLESRDRARAATDRALEIDDSNPLAWNTLSMIAWQDGALDQYKSAADMALARSSDAFVGLSQAHQRWLADPSQRHALVLSDALETMPGARGWANICRTHLALENNDLNAAKRALPRIIMPGFFWSHILAAALDGLTDQITRGRKRAAHAEKAFSGITELLKRQPDNWIFPKNAKAAIVEGLSALGRS